MRFAAFAPLALLVLAACGGTQSVAPSPAAKAPTVPAPGRAEAGVTADCAAWASAIVGPYKYENNVWGIDKARTFTPEQCLLRRTKDGQTEIGWTWAWPGQDPTVFAYPQIMFGWKPWSGGKPSDPRFPLKITAMQSLSMDYEVETQATGSYNLAPEIWLTSSGNWSEQPNAKLITTEIMFWMDYQQGAIPAGQIVDQPVLGGVRYDLFRADNIGDRGDGRGWTLYSFRSPTRQLKGQIPIDALLRYMVGKGLVNPEEYIASVEFGNEVVGGSGTTWVKKFAVNVAP